MNGQLYQECDRRGCDYEPVCVDCQYCERHCICPPPPTAAEVAEQQRRHAIQFGREKIIAYIREFAEHGDFRPLGKKIFDNVNYAVGYQIFHDETDGMLYLVHHTGSRVDDWSTVYYRLPPITDDDSFGNGNADILATLAQLAGGEPLNEAQKYAFSY